MENVRGMMISVCTLAILVSSCNNASNKDMHEASQNFKDANGYMKEAIVASKDSVKAAVSADWKIFKSESDTAVAVSERQITMLENKIINANNMEKDKLRAGVNKTRGQLDELKNKLQQRNSAFENEINQFDSTVTLKNKSFEREFKHDMNELGSAFKDIFKDNVK